MEREYEFFVTTQEPHQPEGADRKTLRRLVMRNFFETKWSDTRRASSEHSSASTVQAKTKLKSRFRVWNHEREKTDKNLTTDPKRIARRKSPQKGDKKKVAPERSSVLFEGYRKDGGSGGAAGMSSATLGDTIESVKKKERAPKLVLKVTPSAHRFDPFDVLPVPGSLQLDILFQLYKTITRANLIAINARSTWWPFISNDAGLLHATLATWALYGMLTRGMAELRVDKLRHKNAALQEVNTKINDPGGKISDELVGTVVTLASLENLLGAYDAAQLHNAALKRMINARGGLLAFGHNDGLMRGILWVDFHTAAAFRTPPSFPRTRLDANTPFLPEGLLEEAAYTSPTCILQLTVASIDCFNIFYRLHRLGLAVSSRWIHRVSCLAVSNLLYETEHAILSVPDHSRDFLDFDLESKIGHLGEYDQRRSVADGASVTEALLAAGQIFVYAVLRELPPNARIFKILLDRLRMALDRPKVSMIEVWSKARNLSTLLWVLLVASSVALEMDGRTWWVGRLAEVVQELGIQSQSELQSLLERVAWSDGSLAEALEGIWDEIAERVRVITTSFSPVGEAKFCKLDTEERGMQTIDPQIIQLMPEKRGSVPLQFENGRWKVNNWYV